jgi:exopolysaccharide biosynthesis polyprenyl glycosylphosphotransferase
MAVVDSAAADYVPNRYIFESRRAGSRSGLRSHRSRLFGLDLAAGLLAAVVAYGLRAGRPEVAVELATVALPTIWVLTLGLLRAYDGESLYAVTESARRIGRAAIALTAVAAAICLVLGATSLSVHVVIGIPLAAVLTIVGRHGLARWLRSRRRAEWARRSLVVGDAQGVAVLTAELNGDPTHGLDVIGACLAGYASADEVDGVPVPIHGKLADVCAAAVLADCTTVVVLPSAELDGVRLRRLAWELHDAGVELVVASALRGVSRERLTVRRAGESALLYVRAPVHGGFSHVVKSVLDRAAAVALLIAAAPLLLAIMVAIRVDSPGPALLKQRRVARGGREFNCLKFRTMVVDAEARKAELRARNEATGLFKLFDDPRVTRVGRILRRSSLDELPQLLNVIRGEMSLVGPRPLIAEEDGTIAGWHRRRLYVRPGMSGVWQVMGSARVPLSEMVELDNLYVLSWSPWLDLKILLRTAAFVLARKGM